MSQEQVGALMGKRHTTIGRWETGKMKLSTTDLERLAGVYGVSVTQLQMSPDAADLVARLGRAQDIMSRLEGEDLDAWLAMGERLASR